MHGALAALCAALMLWFSDAAMQAASTAAQVFVSGVLPALFPMMVLSRLTPPSPKSAASRLFVQTALFAFASGSPASAQRVGSLWDAGRIPPHQLEPLLCAVGVMSPMFFTGTLAAWTGLKAGAWLMLLAHWLGALVTAALWRLLPSKRQAPPAQDAAVPPSVSITAAISQSAQSLLAVCGAMMVFSIVAGILRQALGALFPQWTRANAQPLAILWALLEIGGGAKAVVDAFSSPPLPLLCALCSFGGLSIWLQNLLFVGESIRPAKLLCMRALHGAVSMLLCQAFLSLSPF